MAVCGALNQRRKEKRCAEISLSGRILTQAMQREGFIDVY